MDKSLILHPRPQRKSLLGRRGHIPLSQPLKVPPSPVTKTTSSLGRNSKMCAVSTNTSINYDYRENRKDAYKVLQDHTNKPLTTKNKILDVSIFKTDTEPKEPICRSYDLEEFFKMNHNTEPKRDVTISTVRSLFGNKNKFEPVDTDNNLQIVEPGIIPLSPFEMKKEESTIISKTTEEEISPNDSFVEHETIIGSLDFSPLNNTLDKTLMNQTNTPSSFTIKRQLSSGKKRTLRKSLSLYKNVLNNTQMNAALCMITEEKEETPEEEKEGEENTKDKYMCIINMVDKMLAKQNAIERKLTDDLEEVKKQKEDMMKLKEMMQEMMMTKGGGKSWKNTTTMKSSDKESQKVLREMRTSISFLKTPRALESYSPVDLRTPHSMSFCVQDQYEKLLLHN